MYKHIRVRQKMWPLYTVAVMRMIKGENGYTLLLKNTKAKAVYYYSTVPFEDYILGRAWVGCELRIESHGPLSLRLCHIKRSGYNVYRAYADNDVTRKLEKWEVMREVL